MPSAPEQQPKPSRGNLALLVLVDTTQAEHTHLPETVFAALGHFGMPYQVLDLGRQRLEGIELQRYRAVVNGQEHLGLRLSSAAVAALLNAVEGGLGLINFDHDLTPYGDAYAAALGLVGANATGRIPIDGTEAVVVRDNDHYISYTQEAGATHRLKMPVPIARVRVGSTSTRVLAETADGSPLVVATPLGRGRIVQWLASPKLWLRQYFGHARGIDDLFWKGIVWAARKPLVMNAMPPFVRLRFDDCNGLWRDASDFRFVDVLNEYGHKPSLCLCMRAVTPDGAGKVRQLYERGLAELAPHTLRPGTSIFYGDDHGEYTEEQLREILAEVDRLFAAWGVTPSKILSDHDHEYSPRVLPLLKERGICFKMNITLPGERWTDVHTDWRPAPYGSMDYALDYLPGNRDLFVVFNHHPSFEYARAYLPDGRFLYNRAGGFGPYKWDFLNGLTTYRQEREQNDVEAAAQRLAAHTRLGLDSLFFGGSITHSHFTQQLSEGEWRALLERYERLTARYQKLNVGYDEIAEYARSKVDSHLAYAEVDEVSGAIRCTLVGETSVPLRLSIFRDADEGVEQRFEAVPAFAGQADVTFGPA